jgi:hypothetical protein
LKIRIIKSSGPLYWYAKEIGKEFDVISYDSIRNEYRTYYGIVAGDDVVLVPPDLKALNDDQLDAYIHEINAELKRRRYDRLIKGGDRCVKS